MVQRRISEAQSWQIIGMHTTGVSFKAIGCQMCYHYAVVSRLVRKHTQTSFSPADFRRFLTVLVDRRLLGRQCCLSMGLVANGIRLTKRCNAMSETKKYSLYPKEHPANCPLRWRLSNGLGCISHDCKLDLVTMQGNLTGDQYIRDVLQPVGVLPFPMQ
jgi:hypothetical protein